MPYYDGWLLANDHDFMNRCGMCAEEEGLGFEWGVEKRHSIASAPGFSEDYAYALLTGVEKPGAVQEVISDDEILAAVAAINTGGTKAVKSVSKAHRLAPQAVD